MMNINKSGADAHFRLANIHKDKGEIDRAISCYKKALQLDPDFAEASNNLGRILHANGQFGEAARYFRQAVGTRPDNYDYYRDLIFSMLYDSRCDGQSIFSEHLKFAKQFEGPLLPLVRPHANEKTADRRLKIGYVSPDFRRHSVSYFIEPVLSCHDREHFEIFCYSLSSLEDEVTVRMKKFADHWKRVAGIQDDQASELIRNDGIDILLDLAGHAFNGRILLFARKPAPIQTSWIGYPATTGLSGMDYKIVDGFTDPPGMTEQLYSEELMRMPGCFLCYLPERASPEVGGSPVVTQGEITFGSFNDLAKETPEVIALWSAILKRIPDSLLILKAKNFADSKVRQRIRGLFERQGIDSGQIELLPFSPTVQEHLRSYNHIDIGLDPFPYNGTTTTCEALWMGVPVITLEGNTHASRVGVSLLSNVGLPELIAATQDEYVQIAVDLAADIGRLQSMRRRLRDTMKQSPLTDKKRFTLNLEDCYRKMWRAYCNSP